VFTQAGWEERILEFIATSRLPFQLIEHPNFYGLIQMARLAPTMPIIPSAKTIRGRLGDIVKERQKSLLAKLPSDAKLSIALDCWTSPFRQAFMAVTGYFIDHDWKYREVLLGFEPLSGSHSGINLGAVLFELLQQHQIEDRVLAITADNASNNNTLMENIRKSLESLELPNQTPIIRIPCMAHVIQLSLKALLGAMEADPQNDEEETEWNENEDEDAREIVRTLKKVKIYSSVIHTYTNIVDCLPRFDDSQSSSIRAPIVGKSSLVFSQKTKLLVQFKMSGLAGTQPT
jgi:hypothetical protein